MALVVFLRGCNVGGHRTFRPSVLAEQLKDYDVVNIGAAGTFVIRGRTSRARLRADLVRRLPFETGVMICEGRDLIRLASANPFADEPIGSDIVRFVSVLAKRPRRPPSTPISFPADGEWLLRILSIEDRFLFGQYRRQMKAIGYLGAIDKLCGVRETTRNWNTIAAIIKVLSSGSVCARLPSATSSGEQSQPN
jgi:uncharacterized protein (DUF1697 family)